VHDHLQSGSAGRLGPDSSSWRCTHDRTYEAVRIKMCVEAVNIAAACNEKGSST
jgi:hypothetical protein